MKLALKKNNDMFSIHKYMIKKLQQVEDRIKEFSKKDPLLEQIHDKLDRMVRKLSSYKEPYVFSKSYVDVSLNIIRTTNSILHILDSMSEKLTAEDIRSLVSSLESNVNVYEQIIRREYMKNMIMMQLPIIVAVVTYVLAFLYNFIVLGTSSLYYVILPVLGLASLLLLPLGLGYSYILLIAASIFGIFFIPLDKMTIDKVYLMTIHILVLFSASSYFQLLRSVRSKKFANKVKSMLEEYEALDKKIREAPEQKQEPRVYTLMEKALKLFREYYGEDGEKLFKYKLNVLLMHGKSIEEALKTLINNISGKQSYSRNI